MRRLVVSLLALLYSACGPALASAQTPVTTQYVTPSGDTVRLDIAAVVNRLPPRIDTVRVPAPYPVPGPIVTVTDTLYCDSLLSCMKTKPARGIPFGLVHWPIDGQFSGALRNAYASGLPALVDSVRAAKGSVMLSVMRASCTNSLKQFDLAKCKAEIDRIASVIPWKALVDSGYIAGLFILDEPNCASCWGGAPISQPTVDALAEYVGLKIPGVPRVVRVVPWWFGSYQPKHVDAAWAQWEGKLHVPSGDMTPEQFRDKAVAEAKKRGLALIFGLNFLDGGDGSSRIAGTFPNATSSTVNRWQMGAVEIVRVGSVFAAESYACAILSWRRSTDYPASSSITSVQLAGIRAFDGRADVKAALATVAAVAKQRPRTSCGRP